MHREVLAWFDENQRDLPWRKSTAWGVMVSEFMLQQTPVNRVLPIWNVWMNRWPTPKDLSAAKKSDLLKTWGRLGYPRRALRLHETATIIATQHKNQVPNSEVELRKLPGVGEYTAAAIMAFAHKERSLVLDVNIRRLFSRALDGQEFPPLHITKTERQARTELIPKDSSRWAAATMELGALVCTATKPLCEKCPIANQCLWRANGYPKSETKKKPTQKWHGTDRQCRGKILSLLLANDYVTFHSLEGICTSQEQTQRCIDSLVADRLIEISNGSIIIAR